MFVGSLYINLILNTWCRRLMAYVVGPPVKCGCAGADVKRVKCGEYCDNYLHMIWVGLRLGIGLGSGFGLWSRLWLALGLGVSIRFHINICILHV